MNVFHQVASLILLLSSLSTLYTISISLHLAVDRRIRDTIEKNFFLGYKPCSPIIVESGHSKQKAF